MIKYFFFIAFGINILRQGNFLQSENCSCAYLFQIAREKYLITSANKTLNQKVHVQLKATTTTTTTTTTTKIRNKKT